MNFDMNFIEDYIESVLLTASHLSVSDINDIVIELYKVRANNGRVFVLGVGGSAANASHMVNDLRKLCHIEAYCPTDNVSELTARVNDEGWESFFERWLRISKLDSNDAILVLSVGGGSKDRNVSVNLINAIDYAHEQEASVISIVGRPDGYAALHSTVCCAIPIIDSLLVTPISEAFQAIIWHGVVSHPDLQMSTTTW